MTDAPAGIGHNQPPLDELLRQDIEPLAAEARPWIEAVARATATDDDTAQKCVTVAGKLKSLVSKVDTARKQAKEPYLSAGRTVDAIYGALSADIKTACDRVTALIDAFQAEQRRKAEAERRKAELAEELRLHALRQAAADLMAAERAAREADSAADRERLEREAELFRQEQMEAMIQLQELQDFRRDVEAAASAPVAPVTIKSDYGAQASQRTVTTYRVTDPKALGYYLLQNSRDAFVAAMLQLVTPIAKARKLKPGSTEIPGLTCEAKHSTVIRKG